MIAQAINSTIDFDKSKEESRLVIREGIDPDLDELRQVYDSLDNVLDKVYFFEQTLSSKIGEDELARHEYFDALRIQYIPQLGFEMAIPLPSSLTDIQRQEKLLEIERLGFKYQVRKKTEAYSFLVSYSYIWIL